MKKINNQRGFVPVLVAIVIVLMVGGGVYFYSKQKKEVKVENTKVTAEIQATSTKTNPVSNVDNEQPPFQHQFELKNIPKYSIIFSVTSCDDQTCNGPGRISIKDSQSKVLIQSIYSNDLVFFKDTLDKTSTGDTVLYDEQGPVIVGDFNFDGFVDLAVRNGNNSGYGGPSYDIYLFIPANNKFIPNDSLTKLASQNLGMFFVDKDKKILTTYSKDGCCWHETDQYQIINNQPVLIYTLIEDASVGAKVKEEGNMIITEKKLVDGKWVTTTKEVNQKEYLKIFQKV